MTTSQLNAQTVLQKWKAKLDWALAKGYAGLRFLGALMGTSFATGTAPRAIMTSSPRAASSTNCESIVLALCMVYIIEFY